MKFYSFVLIFFVLLCRDTIKAQNHYDVPAEASVINTYVPIDWRTLEKARSINVQVMRKKIINAYSSYQYYPDVINDGWHNVISVMSDLVLSHKVFVKSNRIIKVVIHNETSNTAMKIVKGRCICSELTVYFLEDIDVYNKLKSDLIKID